MGGGVDVLAALNIAKDAFSVASLTLPFIFLSSGLVVATVSVCVLGLGSWAGAVVLHRACLAAAPGGGAPRSYSHCVERLWGTTAKRAADVGIVIVDTSASFAMLIAGGQALHSVPAIAHSTGVFGSYPVLVAVVAAVVAIVCVALPSGDALKYPSALGAVAFVALLVLTGVVGARGELVQHDTVANAPRSAVWSHPQWPASASAVVLAPGVLKFCFAGIESWPSLAVPLGDAYTPTLAAAVAVMMSFTMAMGLVGYAYAPEGVAENVLLNLPDSVAGDSARVATAAMLALTTPILLFAAFEILEFAAAALMPSLAAPRPPPALLTPLPTKINSGAAEPDAHEPTASRGVATGIRLVLVVAAAAAAAAFPNLVYAVSVTGAVGDSALGLVVPGIAAFPHVSRTAGCALVVLGVVCMVCGLVVPFV